jgi:hypothetical protein
MVAPACNPVREAHSAGLANERFATLGRIRSQKLDVIVPVQSP